ncbi:MAG TPA: hypothetical protein VEZ17_10230 [Chitinophagaceae bacterium]|jgi:integral membrane sensor domain MASE1|nr:hypothetical protein [Chitinophagaceae bacterium]
MLSEEEKKFLVYWEEHRNNEKRTLKQWLVGLPIGMLLGIPIFINFFSGWYTRAAMDLNSRLLNKRFNPLVLIIAVLLIISFMAIFSKRHRWEMNEQRYKELKAKEEA